MPAIVRFYPYAFSVDVELRVSDPYDPTQEDVSFDWLIKPEETDDAFLTLNLAAHGTGWAELRFQVTALLPTAELERVLPPSSTLDVDVAMLLSIRCPATKLRESAVLSSVGSGKWEGEVNLRRVAVRNVVEIRPMLVRRTALPPIPRSEFATAKHAIIADGRPVRVIVDASEVPLHGTVEIEWEDFRKSKHPWRNTHSADLFYLDTAGDRPRLWLNSRYTSFKAALHSSAPKGVEATVRHLSNAMIAQAVWLQMFAIAAAATKSDEVDGHLRPSGWQGSVLDTLLPSLFPHISAEEQLEELGSSMETSEQYGVLISKVASAVQDIVGSFKLVERAIRAGERGVTAPGGEGNE